jgi:Protein of unknown function (DUF4231)
VRRNEYHASGSERIEDIVLDRLEDQINVVRTQRCSKPENLCDRVMSVCVSVLLGLEHLSQYHSNWITYRSTCQALKHEKYTYHRSIPGPANSLALLSERLESLVLIEHSKWASVTDKINA